LSYSKLKEGFGAIQGGRDNEARALLDRNMPVGFWRVEGSGIDELAQEMEAEGIPARDGERLYVLLMKAFRFLDVHPALRPMRDAVCLVVIPYSIGKTTAWQILNSLAVTAFAIKFFAISNTVRPLAFRAIISPPNASSSDIIGFGYRLASRTLSASL
jgi:hypothetical protein